MTTGNSGSDLSAFQLEVARLSSALPASQGFLLAGGAALLARTFLPPAPPSGQRSPRKNSPATSCSPCLTGQRHGTSPMSTTRTRRLVRSRTSSVLRNLAIRARSVGRIS
jgi:hypothetical protein